MDLHEHPGAQLLRGEVIVDVEQRDLHDVGSAALDGSVQRRALGILAQHPVRAGEVGERPPAAEDGGGVAVDLGLLDRGAQVVPHRAEPVEVLHHQLLRLGLLDAQLLGQAERRQTVDEAVRHRLHLRAHRGAHILRLHAEHARTDEPVQVFTRVERLDQAGVLGQVRHDAHLDLRVVGGQERLVAVADLERGSDAAALLRAHRDVLQVRVGAREAPGLASGLHIRRADAPVRGDRRVERLDDLAQLGGFAVLQQQIQERVRVRVLQIGEHGGIRRVAGLRLAGLGQLQLFEEHLLQLLGRTEVDLAADRRVGLLRDRIGPLTRAPPRIPTASHARPRPRRAPCRRA